MIDVAQRAYARFPKSVLLLLGLVSATGFAPLNLWPVTLICLAVLITLISDASSLKSALGLGYWFGVGHFTLGLNWIAGSFRYQDAMPVWTGWVAVVAVSLYLAVYPAVAAGLAWRWGRQNTPTFILMLAAAWIVTEYLRATLFTGFAWNPLGVSFVNFGAIARTTGTYGLSGIVILTAGGLCLVVARRWIYGALALALPLLSALATFAELPDLGDGPAGPIIRVVQPNIGQQDKYLTNFDALNFAKLTSLSGTPGAVPRLILWPEAAIPDYIGENDQDASDARQKLAALLGPKDILITGADKIFAETKQRGAALETRWVGAANSSFALDASGKIMWRYDKSHLVPYGEYLALRWLLEPLGATRLVPGALDFWPGPGPKSFAVPGFGKVGVQICYEIVFSGQVIDRDNRPEFLFNPSNDAWFGAWGPPQHLAQARLRALEEGVPVIRSTPTGISAIIDGDGRIVESLPYQRPGFIEARVPRARETTPFARYGNILPIAFAVLLMLLGIAVRPRLR
jgi:apolipoprotein N-acyltransferase